MHSNAELPPSRFGHLPTPRHPPQTPPMRTALKEWAVIVEVLGRGDQIVILRKGGISEGKSGFQLDHSRFLLFPTQFHQHRDQVTPAGQALFDQIAIRAPVPDRVSLEFVATVTGWKKLVSRGQAMGLSRFHFWRPEVIADRFEWGREQAIFVMALRITRLPTPVVIPTLPQYGGCRSWIELAVEVEAQPAAPVLKDASYARQVMALEEALGGPLTSSY